MSKFAAVCFDLDGVVIDSEIFWTDVEREFARHHGLVFNDELRLRIMGLSEMEIAKVLREDFKLTKPAKQIIKERSELAMDIYRRKAQLLPGFLPLIKKIRAAGYPTALVSSSPHVWIDPVAKRLGLAQWFDKIVSADEMPNGQGKPHPAIYLLAAKELGVLPSKCLVLEDSVNGVKAAKAAGMYCVAVPGPWVQDRRGLKAADLIVDNLNNKRLQKLF